MTRDYKLPDKDPAETNWDYCKRCAAAIPPEAIVRAMVAYLIDLENKGRMVPAWSRIGAMMGHGSGVSQAIVELYKPAGLPVCERS